MTADEVSALRQQLESALDRIDEWQARIHRRIDDVARAIAVVERLDERTHAIARDIDAHARDIEQLRDRIESIQNRMIWSNRMAIGGAATGGGGAILMLLEGLLR